MRGHVEKWEFGGLQNRYERVRFPPWPPGLSKSDSDWIQIAVPLWGSHSFARVAKLVDATDLKFVDRKVM